MITSCLILHRMKDVSEKSCTENQNTHNLYSNFLYKPCCLQDNVEKYGTVRQATDDMAHSQCMLNA